MRQSIKEVFMWLYMIVAVLVMIYAFYDVVKSNAEWYKDLAVYMLIICLMMMVLISVIYIWNKRQKKAGSVYISYNPEYETEAQRISNLFPREMPVLSVGHIFPGENVYETIPSYIASSKVCYVLIGKKVSQLQKYEISEMKRQNKKIIPILLDTADIAPKTVKDRMPVTYNNFIQQPYIP